MTFDRLRRTTYAAVTAAALLGAYRAFWRWQLRWGATDEEAVRPMPGDPLVPRADVQIGSGRAGWYAIDRLDNAGVPSASAILPEHQHLAVGDVVPMVAGTEIGLRVKVATRAHGATGGRGWSAG
jgi:hypothetical protein